MNDETMRRFVLAVANMRRAQKAYFRTRDRVALDAAKIAEYEVDRWIVKLAGETTGETPRTPQGELALFREI